MTNYEGIRGVTFDVGGTLIAPWPSVGDIYAEVAKQHGYVDISPAALNERFRAAWNSKRAFTHRREQWQALVNETFSGLAPGLPGDEFFTDLYNYFARAAAWRVFDDVLPALEPLRARGFKLGVISNWDERLRPLLNELQMARLFNAFSISIEAGTVKPDKAIFELAATRLGLPAHALLHVGDTLSEDIHGARMAGFSALLIDRGAANAPNDGIINTLAHLPRLLEIPLQNGAWN